MSRQPAAATPVRRYVLTWLALLVLLMLTLGTAFIPLGALNVVLNLSISVLKTLLVMVVFMHLQSSPPLIRLASAAGFVWLSLLFTLTLSDYLTR
ncbi:MAG: cytochrome C oxidase subunit IV family protein [Gammaproteobacteria bacterium]|jgi:cytochrome c oxidase subunit 4